MALRTLSAGELADTPTVFASFMGRVGSSHRTLGQLAAIYRERRGALAAADDRAEHLRVECFIEDMAARRWRGSVVVRIGTFEGRTLIIDGVHRGIAYLACVERGLSPETLPALQLDC